MANSGAWLDIMELVNAVAAAGFDRARARVTRALANLPRNAVPILGVEVTATREAPPGPEEARRRPRKSRPLWDLSFGEAALAGD